MKTSKYIRLIWCFILFNTSIPMLFCQEDTLGHGQKDINIPSLHVEENKKGNKLLNRKRKKGYLSCTIDSILNGENKYENQINLGERFYWDSLIITPSTHVSGGSPNGPFSIEKLETIQKDILSNLHENGFPEAKIIQSASFKENCILIHLKIKTGSYIVFDSLLVDTSFYKSNQYLQQITGIKYDKPFNSKLIDNLPSIVNSSNIFEYQGHKILNNNNKALVELSMQKTQSNTFTGFAGIQPNQDGKVIITGQVSLHLRNAFNSGELINLEWKKNNPLSQYLDVQFSIPFILRTSVGINADINLDKQDSTFTNTTIRGGISFYLYQAGYINLKIKHTNSVLNASSQNQPQNSSSTLYGLSYLNQKLNRNYNPTKGFNIKIESYAGNRMVTDTEKESKQHFRYDYSLFGEAYLPIGKNTVLLKNNLLGLASDSLQQHELIRVGGIQTLRGFNENSIFTKAINITTLEYRFLLDQYSNINSFIDYGISNDVFNSTTYTNQRIAIGAGMNIHTKAGNLTLSYAVGKLNNNPFTFSEGKIHIGYINQF